MNEAPFCSRLPFVAVGVVPAKNRVHTRVTCAVAAGSDDGAGLDVFVVVGAVIVLVGVVLVEPDELPHATSKPRSQ